MSSGVKLPTIFTVVKLRMSKNCYKQNKVISIQNAELFMLLTVMAFSSQFLIQTFSKAKNVYSDIKSVLEYVLYKKSEVVFKFQNNFFFFLNS